MTQQEIENCSRTERKYRRKFLLSCFFVIFTQMATFPSFNAKDREERKIALAIFLAYSTIKEWYYLIRQQEKVPEVNQNEGELYSFGITTYPQRLSHFFFH